MKLYMKGEVRDSILSDIRGEVWKYGKKEASLGTKYKETFISKQYVR